jgi:hypothetical protein
LRREGILSFTGTTNLRSKKLKREVKRLQDEFVTLKTAIEEAIIKGQKSRDDLSDIPSSGPVSNKDLAHTRMIAGSQVGGLVDDFHRRAAGL